MRQISHAMLGALLSVPLFLAATPALADDVVVMRNVTVREQPNRDTPRVDYPAIGSRLTLLDDGRQERGYYHVRLTDGREGWIYRTFVRRVPSEEPLASVVGADLVAVHYIDVDQGNAALVEFPCAAVLIDAGGFERVAADRLTDFLEAFFARRTDLQRRLAAVYVTHTHADHNTALGAVVYRYRIGAYIDNGLLNGSGEKDAVWMAAFTRDVAPPVPRAMILERDVRQAGTQGLTSSVIDPVACAGVDPRIRVLTGSRARQDFPQWSNDDFGNGNNHSVVIRIDYGEASFLFTGDIENAGIADLLSRYAGTGILDADVIKISHHGAANGTTQPFLDAVTPQIAVISMGRESTQGQFTAFQFGHPRKATVGLLHGSVSSARTAKQVRVANGVRSFEDFTLDRAVYGTGWDGTVVVRANPQGQFSVTTER